MSKRYPPSSFSTILVTGSIAFSPLVLAACEDVLNYGSEPAIRAPSAAAHQAGAAGRASGSGGTGSAVHLGGSRSGSKFVETSAAVGVGVVTASASGGTTGAASVSQSVPTVAPVSSGASSLESKNLSAQVFGSTNDRTMAGGGTSGGELAAGGASGTFGAGGRNGGNAGNGTSGVGGGHVGGTAAAGATATSPDAGAEYSCSVDLARNWSDCQAPAVQLTALAKGEGALTVDMSSHRVLRLVVEVEDPHGFVLDIGDSYCNDAGGGDCDATYYDAELDVQQTPEGAFPMVLYLNDSSVVMDESTTDLATYPGLFSRTGRTERILYLADRKICLDGITQCWQDDALLRLAGSGASG
ncbi:MAG TPA: hypothetical protein VKP30_02375, partial [Polyangiaceae bacterium]|nr:hypothetical protein [Polyangiaceae bacterium]